jgi:hypothetical protein
MKKFVLVFLFFLSFFSTQAQELSFSDSARISLITCSPGPEVYAKFGHTAIRIVDQNPKIDVVFNYGLFSFETSNFYFKFIKGETDYQLGVFETAYFLPEYKERNSNVWEQKLNLTVTEKRRLINSLMDNYRPENRIYRYNFVFDNCATRPRDKIMGALSGYVRFENLNDSKTFRQWIGTYVGNDSWLKFGIDLVFGLDADRTATESESMFLPEVLMSELQTGQIVEKNNLSRKLVSDKVALVIKDESKEENAKEGFATKPLAVAIALLLLGTVITLWDYSRKRHFKTFDSVLMIVTGLTGIVVMFLMFLSSHPLVKSNLNLLWLNPLNIVFGILIWVKDTQVRRLIFFYQIFNIILLVGALFAFALSIQSFNLAVFPILVLMLMRSSRWFAYTKHKLYKRRELR